MLSYLLDCLNNFIDLFACDGLPYKILLTDKKTYFGFLEVLFALVLEFFSLKFCGSFLILPLWGKIIISIILTVGVISCLLLIIQIILAVIKIFRLWRS